MFESSEGARDTMTIMKAVLALTLALAGCSFVTMHGPHGSPPQCTQSRVVPLADLVVAVASPLYVYSSVRGQLDSNPPQELSPGVLGSVVISFPVWAVFGASSIYGFVKADRCSTAKREYQQVVNAPRTASPPVTAAVSAQ
jgi:hypothetical protein